MSQAKMKQQTTAHPINRPISALQPLDSQPAKFNMMQKLPSETSEVFVQTQATKTSQKNIRKLPTVEKLVKKSIKTTIYQAEKPNLGVLPPLENKPKSFAMNKSDTFLSEEFKKQIAKPFKKRSLATKISVQSTVDPSLKDSSSNMKSLKESLDFDQKFMDEEELSARFLSKSMDYSQEIDRMLEKKNQEKIRKISELTDFLKDLGQKNKNNIIEFPKNFNNFVDVFTDEVKFSKDHIAPENLEGALKEMKLNFDMRKQKLQRIKDLEKILDEKERKYKDLMKNRVANKDDISDISSNYSENSRKLFITDFKHKKPQNQQKPEDIEDSDQDNNRNGPLILVESSKKPERDFLEINRKNPLPLRYQFECDKLPEEKKERLDYLMREIEGQILGGSFKGGIEIEKNPFSIEENREKMKEIDEKLRSYKREVEEEKGETANLEGINDALYKLSVIGRDQGSLEKRSEIESLVSALKMEENKTIIIKDSRKFNDLDEKLQELERKAESYLNSLNVEELRAEISESKQMIESSINYLENYRKGLDKQYEAEMKELESDYNRKRGEYFREVMLRLQEEFSKVNELYNETSEFEKKLSLKVQSTLKELGSVSVIPELEESYNLPEVGKEEGRLIGDEEKTIEEYDQAINEKVRQLHPELFENID